MAKTQERGIRHVKDVFSGSGEASRHKIGHSSAQTSERVANFHRAIDSNKPHIAPGSNGDIVFKRPDPAANNNNKESKTNWKPVEGKGYGVTRTYGKKRQAPQPPTQNGTVPSKEKTAGHVNKLSAKEQGPGTNSNIKQKGKVSGNVANSAGKRDSAHMAARTQLVPAPARDQTSQAFRHTQTSSKTTPAVSNGVDGTSQNKYKPNVNVNVNGYMRTQSRSPTRTTIPNKTKDTKTSSSKSAYTGSIRIKQVFSNGQPRSSIRQSTGSETGSSGYQSESPVSPGGMKGVGGRQRDSDSDFYEEECTLNFGDEEDARVAQGKHTRVYKEYDGDDFAQYLKDEPSPFEYPTERRAYRKNKPRSEMGSPPPLSPNTLERQEKKAGLKDKLSAVFTLSKTEKRRYFKNVRNASNNIHNFTFSDSKMALSLDGPGEAPGATDIQSDIGGYATSGGSWWSLDTLSSRKAKSRSEIGGLFSKSTADLRMSPDADPHYHTMPEKTTNNYADSTIGKKKKSNNILRKVSRTLRRKKGPNLELSLAPMVEDTRL